MPRVKIDLDLNKSNFDAGMKGVEKGISGLKNLVAGAFTVSAIVGFINKTAEAADEIDKASLRMKTAREETGGLKIVAREAGLALGDIEAGFKKIEMARAKALGGDIKALAAFSALGIGQNELSKSNNTMGLAGKIAGAARDGSNDKEGVAIQSLGLKKISTDLAAMGDSLQDFDSKIKELKANGQIMTDADIANIARAKDELEAFNERIQTTAATALGGSIGYFEGYFIILTSFWSRVFKAITGMAMDTIKYIIDLPSSIYGTLSGRKKGIGNRTLEFGNDINKDIVGNLYGLVDDVKKGFSSRTERIEADRLRREKLINRPPGTDDSSVSTDGMGAKNTEPFKKEIYSDNLTRVGNMLGASFSNMPQVSAQLAVEKDHFKESQTQTALFKIIADNTSKLGESNGNEDWN